MASASAPDKRSDESASKPAVSPSIAPAAADATSKPASTKSPLSSFVDRPKIHDAASALLEVDHLSWPQACQELQAHSNPALAQFTDYLVERIGWGHKIVALTSCRRGEGRTTVSLILAKQFAARGLRAVVVDADFENPLLARVCGIQDFTGWGEMLHGEIALGEALIAAVDEQVTLMPWRGAPQSVRELARSQRIAANFGMLRDHYDIVLLDTMPLMDSTEVDDFGAFAKSIGLDALYLINDVRSTAPETVAETWAQLRRAGAHVEAIIENFVAPHGSRFGRPESPGAVANAPLAA
jgi:Mrp family chromosome partitioning ATPase